MVADDDPIMLMLLKKFIEGAGYQVREAADGGEALTAIASGVPPDLLVTDVNMPRLNGMDLVKGIRETLGLLDLNRQRQTVFVNKAFAGFLAEHGITDIRGHRFGNLAGCAHAEETAGGCGTTESCRRCGAALATEQALSGKEAVKECRIMSKRIGEDLDLHVNAKPFCHNGEQFILLSLMDISSEKRRVVLERLFFHDILNTAGGVQGLIGLMSEAGSAEIKSYVPAAAKASDRMVDQIISQKDLSMAGRGDLQARISECRSSSAPSPPKGRGAGWVPTA